MAGGALLTAIILITPSRWFGVAPRSDLPSRLAYAIRADAVAMLWLLAAVANVARRRFFSPADIDGGGLAPASNRISVEVAIVQNTLEQSALASVLYLSLACLTSGDEFLLIPQLLTLFCIGRLTFWLGYRHGAPWRAFGFAATFYPTVFGYALLVSHWIPG
jgi:uncharacterized membrane protein YecN with MAPEG domain